MVTKIRLQADLKEFLRLLDSNKVEYLLIGGYAVGYWNTVEIDGVEVSLIDLEHLLRNKAASGRLKDLDDLENLTKLK
jgi:predicted nucleotidyltransferase